MAKKDSEAVKPSEVSQQTPKGKLKTLMSAARSAYKDARAIAGGYGEKVAQLVEHEHLHKKAWASVVAEDRMTPEKLAEFYDTQAYYRDVLGLNERAESAPKLRLEPDKEDAEDDGEEKKTGTVSPFPAPATRQ